MREIEPETKCCCLRVVAGVEDSDVCGAPTSGPDDPFCYGCTNRHAHDAAVIAGVVQITARLPIKERR